MKQRTIGYSSSPLRRSGCFRLKRKCTEQPKPLPKAARPNSSTSSDDDGSTAERSAEVIFRDCMKDGALEPLLRALRADAKNVKEHVAHMFDFVMREPTQIAQICEILRTLFLESLVTDKLLGDVISKQLSQAQMALKVEPEVYEDCLATVTQILRALKQVSKVQIQEESTSF